MMDGHYPEARFLPADEYPCQCVADHNPNVVRTQRHHIWPKGWGGPDTQDNIVPMCGTGHDNVHVLLDAYKKHGGTPPWSFRRQFGQYIRDLAAEGWSRYLAAQPLD